MVRLLVRWGQDRVPFGQGCVIPIRLSTATLQEMSSMLKQPAFDHSLKMTVRNIVSMGVATAH